MSRIIDYPVYTGYDAPTSDNFIIDNLSKGTRRTRYRDVAVGVQEIYSQIHIPYRKNIYNAVDLGQTFTEDQNAALSGATPTFANLYIGAYWTINNRKYVIADFDYWYNKYDKLIGTQSTNNHHVVLLPVWTDMPSGKMNDTPTVEGGYLNSKMYTEYMSAVTALIEEDWGDHILTHRECFTNATTYGYPSAQAWVDSKYDLMNEFMVYGSYIHAVNNGSISNDRATLDTYQLSLFRLNYSIRRNINNTWLRDIVDSSHFAITSSLAGYGSANTAHLIRPVFGIKAT